MGVWLALLLLQQGPNELTESLRLFASVYGLVEAHAAVPPDANQAIYEGALPALLRRLDPHSVFLTPAQVDQLREMERSTSKGFGTIVSVLPGRVIVLQTLAGAPGAKAGIAPGDEIVAINGVRLDLLDMDQLVGLLSETRRRPAQLYVRRPGSALPLSFTLLPEEMASPSVDRAFLLEDGTGYVRITSFEVPTGEHTREAIERLGGKKLGRLILDLRNNPGGVLTGALETAALFLKPGQNLLATRGRARPLEESKVPEKAQPYEFPLAVLINEKTASAAEIVAGALQDHDRAVIVGTPSFGKGLVQSIFPLAHGTGMALTTAFYFTPSGRSIQKPLSGSQIGGQAHYARLEDKTEFTTAKGRKVRGGGGIEPDITVGPESQTRLRMVLEATAALTSFATEFLKRSGAIRPDFQVTSAVLDELQLFLSQRNIRPGLSEWSTEREWIRSRLHQEILNQAVGVDKGDEIEARRDPQVRRAADFLRGEVYAPR